MSFGLHAADKRGCDHLPNLTAREVCQILREVTFERSAMTVAPRSTLDEADTDTVIVDVDGWRITLHNDCDGLAYCAACVSAQGQRWAFEPGDRLDTNPVALLSTWEHATLDRLLKSL